MTIFQDWLYLQLSFHIHFLTTFLWLFLSLHWLIFSFLWSFFGLFLLLLRLRRWWRNLFTHNRLNFFVNFLHLIFDLLSSDRRILPLRNLFLFFARINDPCSDSIDETVALLPLLWRNMLVLFILNQKIYTKLLRKSRLYLMQSSRILI